MKEGLVKLNAHAFIVHPCSLHQSQGNSIVKQQKKSGLFSFTREASPLRAESLRFYFEIGSGNAAPANSILLVLIEVGKR
jgi:hypothetical protein